MRFGVYLMRRGVITANQFVEALQEQLDQQPPMGQLAIEEGALSVREVFDVLRSQSDSTAGRFGDAAMELGLLARQQVAELLLLQADRVPPLEEVLVKIGILDQDTVVAELAAFRCDMESNGAQRSDAFDSPTAVSSRIATSEPTPMLAF
ncbi:MAG: hypothetical protein AAF596_07570 [Planctomycetota bacterium]